MEPTRDDNLRHAQNFLTSARLVDALLDRSSLGPADLVYEIGPGDGAITERLARRVRRVIAVEKDPQLARRLQRRFASQPSVTIIEGDALRLSPPGNAYKVFANPPFNHTAAIITKLTSAPCPPEDTYLVLQREAAQRILGLPRATLYGVLLQPWFESSVVHCFRRGDFAPAPGVDVVLLRLRKRGPPLVEAAAAQAFRDFVVYGFTAPTASLGATLTRVFGGRRAQAALRGCGLACAATPSMARAEDWLALFTRLRQDDTRTLLSVRGAERRLRRQQSRLTKLYRTRRAGGA